MTDTKYGHIQKGVKIMDKFDREIFVKAYLALTKEDQAIVKAYFEDMLKDAIFPETYDKSENALLIIRDIENGEV